MARLHESGIMPTVLRWRGWIFLFYSADGEEPPHVHVRKGRQEVKFWLADCGVAAMRRVSDRELRVLQAQVRQHRDAFLEGWHEHFGGR
jgi:Domain of unknown function (DUF4160)